MNNKILIELVVPILEESFDVYVPINLKLGNVIEMCSRAVSDLSGGYYVFSDISIFYNGDTGERYGADVLVRNTDIRNGTKLILM